MDCKIRRILKGEIWYYCVTDILKIIAQNENSMNYWKELKEQLDKDKLDDLMEGSSELHVLNQDGSVEIQEYVHCGAVFQIISLVPNFERKNKFEVWFKYLTGEELVELAC